EDLHVVEDAVAEEPALMAVEGGGEPGEHRVAGIEPARAGESRPFSLWHDVRSGKAPLEIRRHDAVEARQGRSDTKLAQAGDDLLRGQQASAQQRSAHRPGEAAEVAHQLPVLMCRLGEPAADFRVGIADLAESTVEN